MLLWILLYLWKGFIINLLYHASNVKHIHNWALVFVVYTFNKMINTVYLQTVKQNSFKTGWT